MSVAYLYMMAVLFLAIMLILMLVFAGYLIYYLAKAVFVEIKYTIVRFRYWAKCRKQSKKGE